MTTSKTTYFFADGEAEGHDGLRAILGGKGAGLAEMTRLGIPVPPGFTISAEHCREWQSAGELQSETLAAIDAAVARLEACTGKTFGGGDDPLFVSVRSGASVSMPVNTEPESTNVGSRAAWRSSSRQRQLESRSRIWPRLASSSLWSVMNA